MPHNLKNIFAELSLAE